MIASRQEYLEYRQADLRAHGLEKCSLYDWGWRDALRFQLRLRKIEYLHNCRKASPVSRCRLFVLEVLNHRLATRLGFTIPKNVFGPGLCIVHYGTIVVSPKAKVGKNCRLHPSTCLGDHDGAPTIGNNVYIGPGAKIFGPVSIGNNVAIGANSVVNHNFGNNVSIGGSPAVVISDRGAFESGVYPLYVKK